MASGLVTKNKSEEEEGWNQKKTVALFSPSHNPRLKQHTATD